MDTLGQQQRNMQNSRRLRIPLVGRDYGFNPSIALWRGGAPNGPRVFCSLHNFLRNRYDAIRPFRRRAIPREVALSF